jgi:hypothetical protein
MRFFVLFYPTHVPVYNILKYSGTHEVRVGLCVAEFGIGAACCCDSVILVLMLWV